LQTMENIFASIRKQDLSQDARLSDHAKQHIQSVLEKEK